MKIIVTGHGEFSKGIVTAVEMITGEKSIEAISFSSDLSTDELDKKIKNALSKEDDNLILCDLKGGTPYNLSAKLASENSNVYVIGGTNLGMAVEATLMKNSDEIHPVIDNILMIGSQSIGKYETVLVDVEDEDEL